jgi:hypothetical protein
MTLRLFLVGLVAGLGVTFPNAEQWASWRGSAQGWVSARVAEWDARVSADDGEFVVIDEPPARGDATPRSPDGVRGEGEAEVVADCDRLAEMVRDDAAGLDIPIAPVGPFDNEVAAAGVDAAFEEAEAAVLLGFSAAAAEVATRDEPVPSAAVAPRATVPDDAAFCYAQESVVEAFAADRARPEPLDVGDDLYPGLAYALNRSADGLNPVLCDPTAVAVAAARVRSFEPPDAPTPPDAGTVFALALNRESEGLDLPASSPALVEAPPPPRQGERLTQAVRLTREAVYAWANLLHGPAVVTLAH